MATERSATTRLKGLHRRSRDLIVRLRLWRVKQAKLDECAEASAERGFHVLDCRQVLVQSFLDGTAVVELCAAAVLVAAVYICVAPVERGGSGLRTGVDKVVGQPCLLDRTTITLPAQPKEKPKTHPNDTAIESNQSSSMTQDDAHGDQDARPPAPYSREK